jgi:hypothetical protein
MAAKDADGEDINIKELQGKQDRIRDLMRRDPKFIGRLIVVSSQSSSVSAHIRASV